VLVTATSLPELFTGLSPVTAADAPNIAVGDALGSCAFNLVMLVLLDELSRKTPMHRRIDQGHILTGGFGVILIGAAGGFLLLSQNAQRPSPARQRLEFAAQELLEVCPSNVRPCSNASLKSTHPALAAGHVCTPALV
jgi:hypothetical protein